MNPNNATQVDQTDIRFGTVIRFDADRGFGFVSGDDGKTYYIGVGARRRILHYGVNGRRTLKHGPQTTFGPPTNERINPFPGDRLMFRVVPPRDLGKYPSAYPWGFVPDQELTEGGQP